MENGVYMTVDWLKANYDSLSKKHKDIARVLMENPTLVLSLSIDEFAKEVGVSRATVFRFCEVLGLNGYTDLKRCFSARHLKINSKIQTPKMEWLTRSMYNSLYYTLSNIDPVDFAKAVNLLKDAKRICWFGAGESGILGELGNHRCWLLGMDSYFFRERLELSTFDVLLDDSNVYIFLSVSGEGPYFELPLKMIRDKNLNCIAITSKHLSSVAEAATVTLYAASPRSKQGANIVPIKIGFEALINALLYEAAKERGIKLDLGDELF